MSHSRVQIAVLLVVIAVCMALFNGIGSRGQSRNPDTPGVRTAVKPVLKSMDSSSGSESEPSNKAVVASPIFAEAATSNMQLSTQINWIFGGTQQQGWYLYTPLISRLLNTEHDTASAGFAGALSQWQEKCGLNPNGVLDEESLYAMVSDWQGRRIKDRSYAEPGQLITAPASDFYDPSRPDELRQVQRETYRAYKAMVAAAAADPSLGLDLAGPGELSPAEKYLKIISAFRSHEYQERLRRESPNAGSAGLAVNSPHFTGRALDLYVGADPVDTRDSNRAIQVKTHVYQWLVKNAESFGFQPYFYEPWHWEYVKK